MAEKRTINKGSDWYKQAIEAIMTQFGDTEKSAENWMETQGVKYFETSSTTGLSYDGIRAALLPAYKEYLKEVYFPTTTNEREVKGTNAKEDYLQWRTDQYNELNDFITKDTTLQAARGKGFDFSEVDDKIKVFKDQFTDFDTKDLDYNRELMGATVGETPSGDTPSGDTPPGDTVDTHQSFTDSFNEHLKSGDVSLSDLQGVLDDYIIDNPDFEGSDGFNQVSGDLDVAFRFIPPGEDVSEPYLGWKDTIADIKDDISTTLDLPESVFKRPDEAIKPEIGELPKFVSPDRPELREYTPEDAQGFYEQFRTAEKPLLDQATKDVIEMRNFLTGGYDVGGGKTLKDINELNTTVMANQWARAIAEGKENVLRENIETAAAYGELYGEKQQAFGLELGERGATFEQDYNKWLEDERNNYSAAVRKHIEDGAKREAAQNKQFLIVQLEQRFDIFKDEQEFNKEMALINTQAQKDENEINRKWQSTENDLMRDFTSQQSGTMLAFQNMWNYQSGQRSDQQFQDTLDYNRWATNIAANQPQQTQQPWWSPLVTAATYAANPIGGISSLVKNWWDR